MALIKSSGKSVLAACTIVTLMACDGDTINLGLPEVINEPNEPVAAEALDISTLDDTTENTVGTQNCPPLLGIRSIGAVAGLWDTSETSNGLQDIALTQIGENGDVTFFDFQQDDIGNGDNCYVIVAGTSVIEQLADLTFINTFYNDPDTSCDVLTDSLEITFDADGSLAFTSIDQFDNDNDGDTNESITRTFPEISGVSATDLISCET